MEMKPLPIAVLGVRRETEFGLAFYRNQVVSRYEMRQVPAVEHLLVAPEGARSAIVQFVGGRRVSFLGNFAAQGLDFYWVAGETASQEQLTLKVQRITGEHGLPPSRESLPRFRSSALDRWGMSCPILLNPVILSEVRRQPNAVEGPHVAWQRQRPMEIFHHNLSSRSDSPGNAIYQPYFSAKSCHRGLCASIKAIFFECLHPFSCFSRAIASRTFQNAS
jgi:hypothetical protein